MDDLISCRKIALNRYLYLSPLSRQTVENSDAAYLGDDGYFLYESSPSGIEVLAKVPSLATALRLLDIFQESLSRAAAFGEQSSRRAGVRARAAA